MSIATKMTGRIEEQSEALIGAPILGVACVNLVGTLGYIAAGSVSDIVGPGAFGQDFAVRGLPKGEIRRVGGKPTKLPTAFVIAVTASHVHVLDVRFGPFGRVKIKGEFGRFDRFGLQLAVREDAITTVYHLYSPHQEQDVLFEMMGGSAAGGQYTRELAALIRGA